MGRGQGLKTSSLTARDVLFGPGPGIKDPVEKQRAEIPTYDSIIEYAEKLPYALEELDKAFYNGKQCHVLAESNLLVDYGSSTKKEYKVQILLNSNIDKTKWEIIGHCRYGPGGKNLPAFSNPYVGASFLAAHKAVKKKFDEKINKKNYKELNGDGLINVSRSAKEVENEVIKKIRDTAKVLS